eukprot:559074-Prymnesium_polylepis.1
MAPASRTATRRAATTTTVAPPAAAAAAAPMTTTASAAAAASVAARSLNGSRGGRTARRGRSSCWRHRPARSTAH